MYESKITFRLNDQVQTINIATESHPEDICKTDWQSLVYNNLAIIPEGAGASSIEILNMENLTPEGYNEQDVS